MTGVLRSSPEDFKVDEILGFAASGEGPHALLRVRKRGANTEWVARELARAAGCKPFEVGFAGLKDRNAVTTQSFTVPRGERAAAEFVGLSGEGSKCSPRPRTSANCRAAHSRETASRSRCAGLTATRQALAERLAAHRERAACLTISARSASVATPATSSRCCARAARAGRRRAGGAAGTDDQGFMLSAARSLIFNAILAARVEQGSWNRLLAGRRREPRWPRQRVRGRNAGRGTARTLRRARDSSHRAVAWARVNRWPGAGCSRSRKDVAAQFPEALDRDPRRAHERGAPRRADPRARSRARAARRRAAPDDSHSPRAVLRPRCFAR